MDQTRSQSLPICYLKPMRRIKFVVVVDEGVSKNDVIVKTVGYAGKTVRTSP